jgi:hypothetical protein
MKDRLYICNAEAAQLVRTFARQTGKTITDVVLDALRQYRSRAPKRDRRKQVARWRRLLREDRKRLVQPETSIDALYDDVTGMPR